MKKLRLDIDALAVDTFDPAAVEGERRGTVLGEQIQLPPSVQFSCPGGCVTAVTCRQTCFVSCNGSCVQTCQVTCLTCQQSCIVPLC